MLQSSLFIVLFQKGPQNIEAHPLTNSVPSLIKVSQASFPIVAIKCIQR